MLFVSVSLSHPTPRPPPRPHKIQMTRNEKRMAPENRKPRWADFSQEPAQRIYVFGIIYRTRYEKNNNVAWSIIF
jgi:hypothetical protein